MDGLSVKQDVLSVESFKLSIVHDMLEQSISHNLSFFHAFHVCDKPTKRRGGREMLCLENKASRNRKEPTRPHLTKFLWGCKRATANNSDTENWEAAETSR